MNKSENKNTAFIAFTALGFLLMAAALFSLENYVLTGVLTVLGLFTYIIAGKLVQSKREAVIFYFAFWLGLGTRVSTLFGLTFALCAGMFAICLPVSVFIAAGFSAERMFRRRNLTVAAVLCVPAFYAGVMFLIEVINFGNFSNFTTYIMCIPVIGRNMAILSEPVMTFVLILVLSLIADAIVSSVKKEKLICSLLALVIVLCLVISGIIVGGDKRESDYSLKVAVATQEKLNFNHHRDREYTQDELDDIFLNAVKTAASNNADLLVMSEEFFTLKYDNYETALDFYRGVIAEYQVPTLLTMYIGDTPGLDINQALFIDKNGEIQDKYLKTNLVPFVEVGSYREGDGEPGYLTAELGGHKVNIACIICFDLNNCFFTAKVPEETELLIVPSWDWDNCNMEQKRLAFRSAGLKTTMLKHTYDGYSYVSDPYGVRHETLDMRGKYGAVEVLDVPIWEK